MDRFSPQPVMPYAMQDILEAPVPFLVGLHSRYLQEREPDRRPKGVVYVDLDRDVIHLGFDDETGKRRMTPALPPRAAMKLHSALEENGGSVYLIPNSGIKGCIMTGNSLLVLNDERQKYAQMSNIQVEADHLGRREVFSMTDKAYHKSDLLEDIGGFRSEHGQMTTQSSTESFPSTTSSASKGRGSKKRLQNLNSMFRKGKSNSMLDFENARQQSHLLEMTDPPGFSTTEIRSAFLRFFVSVFKDYESCLLENNENELFDEDMFVDDLHHREECLAYLHRVLKTQMFQRFLEERKDNPNQPEIRFFDESIIAKNNRSKKNALKIAGKKKPTPFLDDLSGKVTKTFTPPPPSTSGLPDGGELYHYGTFPNFDYNLFGRVRPPMVWPQYTRESVRLRIPSSERVRKTQEDIVLKAMRPLLAAPSAFYAVAKRSAKDLESALSILTSPLNPTGGAFNAKARDQDIDAPDDETCSTDEESARNLGALSRADTVVLNARRKQGILVDLVIRLQSTCRMFLAVKKYRKFRRAVFQFQRKFRHAPQLVRDASILEWRCRRAIRLQRSFRGYLVRKIVRQKMAAISRIQRWYRGERARRSFRHLRRACILAQALTRKRLASFRFLLLKEVVSKAQALFRGILVRKRLSKCLELRMDLYRPQIFALWHMAHTSISFRTKLWPALSENPRRKGFLRNHVAELELVRLWHELGLFTGKEDLCRDSCVQLGYQLGIDSKIYCQCVNVTRMLEKNQVPEISTELLAVRLHIEDAERQQIYLRLTNNNGGLDLTELYGKFGIKASEKKKKVLLSILICKLKCLRSDLSNFTSPTYFIKFFSSDFNPGTKFKHVQESVKTMMTLFPELEGSLNINFQNPSGKAKRRFGTSPQNQKIVPVEKSFWDLASPAGISRSHVEEVATIMITKVPKLMARFEELEQIKKMTYRARCDAVMKSRQTYDWQKMQARNPFGFFICLSRVLLSYNNFISLEASQSFRSS